ncbi:non-ribosomal peptide synthetase [Dactylosporangium salmoneum]|uniref:Carrier domain-containing protein n=1 Tax=Dactylosporangium salmoneum TaxID=53361 RepID=A0ABN3GST2_9ACTN
MLEPVHCSFERQRRATPHLAAVEFDGATLTYEELGRRADALAARLAELSVGPGSVVGIAVERSFDLPVAVLGTLRAGAAYLPLDLSYPPDRLDFMLRDGGARVLVAQDGPAGRLSVPTGVAVVRADEGVPPTQLPQPRLDDLAYVLYTSGSTGTPKGVAMPHGPLANLLRWQIGVSSCGEGARTLQYSAAGFDASFLEMFSTWATGGCLVLVSEEVRRDSRRLLRYLHEHRVNRLYLPFVALQGLARAAADLGHPPSALREVMTAGEQLYATPALRAFFAALPGSVLDNQYGPTETHVVTCLRLGPDPAAWPERPTVGEPVADAQVWVLDDDGRPLPPGATGQIALGGPVLARGYLGRPGLTAARFVAAPGGEPGARAYLTGDIGFVGDDGEIRFLGRADDQVKIRGHRVELGEVESAVKALPGVEDAVVVAVPGPAGSRLVAYTLGLAADVRRRLAETLPAYLVPALVVPLGRFPLTPSGKVDRRALTDRPVSVEGRGPAPRDALERELLALWRKTLDVDGVGTEDDFFSVGGDSVVALSLVSELNERLAADAELDTLYERPTVAHMSDWIRERERTP